MYIYMYPYIYIYECMHPLTRVYCPLRQMLGVPSEAFLQRSSLLTKFFTAVPAEATAPEEPSGRPNEPGAYRSTYSLG